MFEVFCYIWNKFQLSWLNVWDLQFIQETKEMILKNQEWIQVDVFPWTPSGYLNSFEKTDRVHCKYIPRAS